MLVLDDDTIDSTSARFGDPVTGEVLAQSCISIRRTRNDVVHIPYLFPTHMGVLMPASNYNKVK